MLRPHITEILRDPYALNLIDTVAPLISQLKTTAEDIRITGGKEIDLKAYLAIHSMLIEKNLILDMIERSYVIIEFPFHEDLSAAWELFINNGDKDALLDTLKRGDEAIRAFDTELIKRRLT
ncbi:hypothetical protein BEP19_15650 [Ammoniphilus oxalaticus]|uniref:Uncharacterized protein n=1 Tax=Ammoniphilus oxalaticus TaxID=66863 RepID=A0A419SDT2_9BACL|nr:hypothetical protein [Ammoniphilus oxalaticus]RKD21107.1 hypothetical protein BEP19_15650 [Ammoniphilus oxalaticus]